MSRINYDYLMASIVALLGAIVLSCLVWGVVRYEKIQYSKFKNSFQFPITERADTITSYRTIQEHTYGFSRYRTVISLGDTVVIKVR